MSTRLSWNPPKEVHMVEQQAGLNVVSVQQVMMGSFVSHVRRDIDMTRQAEEVSRFVYPANATVTLSFVTLTQVKSRESRGKLTM